MLRVLILCTGNSARSIIGEALFATLGAERVDAFSAGSTPSGRIQPLAEEIALEMGYPRNKLRSKSWDEFGPNGQAIDLVITVCGNAATHEACPVFRTGDGDAAVARAHWGVDDPAHVVGTVEVRLAAFRAAEHALRKCVESLLAHPLEQYDRATLQRVAREVGQAQLQA
jgi:arsenate reductase (thioredoxin)